MRNTCRFWLPLFVLAIATTTVSAQSFRVQCPPSTITHPGSNNSEPAYTGPTIYTCSVNQGCSGYQGIVSNAGPNNTGYLIPATGANGAVKCQQISGGDGFSTMGDGTQTYMFSFGPLSGLADIAKGQPGTQFPNVFNTVYPQDGAPLLPGDPATTDSSGGNFVYNGAIGLVPDLSYNTVNLAISSMSETGHIVNFTVPASANLSVGDTVIVSGVTPADYNGMHTISAVLSAGHYQFLLPNSGVGNGGAGGNVAIPPVDGHVDPRQIMDIGVMNGNIPAPLMAIDEDDEFFLTLTNVGMIMRPDLF